MGPSRLARARRGSVWLGLAWADPDHPAGPGSARSALKWSGLLLWPVLRRRAIAAVSAGTPRDRSGLWLSLRFVRWEALQTGANRPGPGLGGGYPPAWDFPAAGGQSCRGAAEDCPETAGKSQSAGKCGVGSVPDWYQCPKAPDTRSNQLPKRQGSPERPDIRSGQQPRLHGSPGVPGRAIRPDVAAFRDACCRCE